MSSITVSELTAYLNLKTNGFTCPICHKQQWEAEQHNGYANNVKLLTEGELHGILNELITESGGTVPADDDDSGDSSTVLSRLAVVRCGHCGWVALFDSSLIASRIHDKK